MRPGPDQPADLRRRQWADVRCGAEGPWAWVSGCTVRLADGGCEMGKGKGTARARRSRPAQIIGSQRTQNMGWQRNRVNVALPLSMIRAEEPVTMRVGDWISLAGLVVSAVGFSVVIRELIRIAHVSEAGQVSHRVSLGKAGPLAGESSSPDATEVERPAFVPLYGGWGSKVRPVWARNASMRAGRYWMRLSRFFMTAASWSTSRTARLPRLAFMAAQAPSAAFSSGA